MVKLQVARSGPSLRAWFLPSATACLEQRRYSAVAVPLSSTKQEPKPSNVETRHSIESRRPNLIELAATITRETEKLDQYLKGEGLQQPGFDVDSPLNFPRLPDSIKKARESVIRASKELGELVTGPTEGIRWMAWDHNNSLSLHAVYHYNIAKSFPLNSTATYAEIAKAINLDEVNTRRLLRHAMTNRIFHEPSPGIVAHTARSRVLATDSAMTDWVGFCVEDLFPAASQTISALKNYPSASEPTQTGFCVANNTVNQEPMFVTFGKEPKRAKRMGGAMTSLTGGEGYEVKYLVDNYDWEAIDKKGGTVVDIGGSHGFVCVDLANRFPYLNFIVQDLPKTVASAPQLNASLASRIRFQAHDFHTRQPVKGADVYLFRWILHNHSTPYAVNMLKQLIPALKKGARIVINDYCLDESNKEEDHDEKIMRTMDLVMLTLLNAQERTEEEFRSLFLMADRRFVFKGVTRPDGCKMSIVEAVWDGEDFDGVGGGAEN